MKSLKLAFALLLCISYMAIAQAPKSTDKAAPASSGPGYHLLNSYPIGGDGGWDYLTVEPTQHRLYISRGNRAIVFDLDTNKVIGEVPAGQGVHGIALDVDSNKGYISNGRDNTVTVFDLKTLQPVGKPVATGKGPDAIIFDAATKQILTMDHSGGDVTVINTKDDSVAGIIKVEGTAVEFGAADNDGFVYVNQEDKSQLAKLDLKKMAVVANWPMTGCTGPSGLAIDNAKKRAPRLFAVCGESSTMIVMDGSTGAVIATAPIGKGPDAAGFDQKAGYAFSSNGEGNVTVVKEEKGDKYVVAEQFDTMPRARTMTFDPKTHNVITVTAKFDPAPAPTADVPRPRPTMQKDSFVILIYGPK